MPSRHRPSSRPHGRSHTRKPARHRSRRDGESKRRQRHHRYDDDSVDDYDLYDGMQSLKLDPRLPTMRAVPKILHHTASKKAHEQARLGVWRLVKTPFSNMGRDSRSRQSAFKPTEGVRNKAISTGLAVITETAWRAVLHQLNKSERARKWGVTRLLGNVQVSPDHRARRHSKRSRHHRR